MWEVVSAVTAVLNPSKIAAFFNQQLLRILPRPFGWICYKRVPHVFILRFVFLIRLIVPTVLASIVLGMPVSFFFICVVISRSDGLERYAIFVGIPSVGSSNTDLSSLGESLYLLLWSEQAVINCVKFVEA